MKGYWLPEDYVLHLNAIEAGWLTAVLFTTKTDMRINKPDANGEPVSTTVRQALIEKLVAAINANAATTIFRAEETQKGAEETGGSSTGENPSRCRPEVH